jgi:hypothetical protein
MRTNRQQSSENIFIKRRDVLSGKSYIHLGTAAVICVALVTFILSISRSESAIENEMFNMKIRITLLEEKVDRLEQGK